MNKSDNEQSRNRDKPVNIKTEKAILNKSVQLKVKKKSIIKIKKTTYTVKRENLISTEREHTEEFQSKTVPVETDENNLVAKHESGEGKSVDILSGQETYVNGSYGSSSIRDGIVSEKIGNVILLNGIIEIIRNSIERAKTYPVLARKRGMEGIVHISFRISPHGIPQDIKILKSSGFRILDKSTLDIVKKAAPFPHIDSPIEVPVVFRLKH